MGSVDRVPLKLTENEVYLVKNDILNEMSNDVSGLNSHTDDATEILSALSIYGTASSVTVKI